ncbi:MAG: FecR domain-containing protein [Rhodocyclaceae bacterium]
MPMHSAHPLAARSLPRSFQHSFQHAFLLPLLLAFCMLLAQAAQAAGAGSVISTSGSASIVSADGKSRKPATGSPINPGDTVVTGEKGQLNIRFSDESIVQLHAESKFKVDQYAFNGKGDENAKGFFSLLKGGMRTVTGLLGKLKPAAYRVYTPTATIGIRGTEYTARLSNGLHVKVDRGEISLTNRAGTFPVTEGQRAYVASQKSAPKYLNLGSAGQNGGSGGNGMSGGTRIQGNTQINASASNASSVAVGQDNAAGNRIGTIGGK